MSNVNAPFRNDRVQHVRRELEHGAYENEAKIDIAARNMVRNDVASTRIPPPRAKLNPECIPCSEAHAISQRIVGQALTPASIDNTYAQARLMRTAMWTGLGILIAVAIVTKLTH